MSVRSVPFRNLVIVAGFAALALAVPASADPPSRIARLGFVSGSVGFSAAGDGEWVEAALNRPLTIGDRLWSEAGGRAEIQVGGAALRLSQSTGISVLALDDRIAQIRLTEGVVSVRIRSLAPGQVFEVDTPNLAFTIRAPGEFRIAVDANDDATTIVVRRGRGEVYGSQGSYTIDAGQSYRFAGSDLRDYRYVDTPDADAFDRWSTDRNRAFDNSRSARYVSPEVIGYQDLDSNGTWRTDASYGNVWFPDRVADGWAPYRDGHWTWVDPWGWTWVDDAPWGFAVSHYGRWAHLSGRWGWVPGPTRARAYYAPALVAFVGIGDLGVAFSGGSAGVAWFPLGPRELYRPSYTVSRDYFDNINRTNTIVNTTIINNTYNNTNVTNIVYANRRVPGAVVAVPATAFVQSQPVGRSAIRVDEARIAGLPVASNPPIAPSEASVRGAGRSGHSPPARTFERAVVARTQPATPPVGIAAQQRDLAAKPGQPLDDRTRSALEGGASKPARAVNVIVRAEEKPPTAGPPALANDARPGRARRQDDRRMAPVEPTQTGRTESTAPAPRLATPNRVPTTDPNASTSAEAPASRNGDRPGRSERAGRPDMPGGDARRGPSAAVPVPPVQGVVSTRPALTSSQQPAPMPSAEPTRKPEPRATTNDRAERSNARAAERATQAPMDSNARNVPISPEPGMSVPDRPAQLRGQEPRPFGQPVQGARSQPGDDRAARGALPAREQAATAAPTDARPAKRRPATQDEAPSEGVADKSEGVPGAPRDRGNRNRDSESRTR